MTTNGYASFTATTDASEPPTRVRYGVLFFLCTLTLILYLDRVCISQAAKDIKSQLHISDTEMGYVFMAFTLAYGLFEVPTGHWGDRYGSRGVLTRIVIWWSAFTALTGIATGLWIMIGIRFLFGAGEAGALPNAARVVSQWFPVSVRGKIQGLVTTSALVGGAIAPTVAAYLIHLVGWRWTFGIFGLLGVVWAAAFYWWFRDDPAQHPNVNAAERELLAAVPGAPAHEHPPIPWARVLTRLNTWLMGGVIACGAFTTYFYFSWYPNYLEEARGLSNLHAGKLSSLVLAGGAAGCLLGGWLTDRLLRLTGNRRWSRSGIGASFFFVAAFAVWASTQTEDALICSLWMGLACLGVHAHVGAWWSATTDMTGKHLGALFGLMNSMGVPGAMASQWFFGWNADRLGALGLTGRAQRDPAFAYYVAVLIVGGCFWLLIDARKSIVEPHPE